MAASLISPWLLWWPPAESHYNIHDHSVVGYVSHAHCIVLLYSVGNKITTTTSYGLGSPRYLTWSHNPCSQRSSEKNNFEHVAVTVDTTARYWDIYRLCTGIWYVYMSSAWIVYQMLPNRLFIVYLFITTGDLVNSDKKILWRDSHRSLWNML